MPGIMKIDLFHAWFSTLGVVVLQSDIADEKIWMMLLRKMGANISAALIRKSNVIRNVWARSRGHCAYKKKCKHALQYLTPILNSFEGLL